MNERDIILDLKNKFNPFYNLYIKQSLEKKIKCFEKNQDKPGNYYNCILNIESILKNNSDDLERKFGKIDISLDDCKNTCFNTYTIEDDKNNCNLKCFDKLKLSSNKLYNEFYKDKIGNRSEYKKIPKIN